MVTTVTTTTFACWSACTVIDKWATAEHGPPITISRCRIATLLQSPLLAVLPYRMGQVSGLAARSVGARPRQYEQNKSVVADNTWRLVVHARSKQFVHVLPRTQIDTSCYTQIVELHELFAARHSTRRYLHPEGVAGLGTTLLQPGWGRLHPGRCSSVRQALRCIESYQRLAFNIY